MPCPPGVQGLGVSYLNSSGGSRAACPDLEEAGTGRGCLPALAGGATLIDDHGLPAKQAHQVGGLLALDHTALAGRQESKSGKWGRQSFCVVPSPPSLHGQHSPGQSPKRGHHTCVCVVWS